MANEQIDIGGGGGGGAANAFSIFQPDSGTSPTADSDADTITLTSSDSSIGISGNSTTDTLDFKEVKTDKSFLSSAVGVVSVLITRIASQTANLFRIADESDNDLFTVDEDGVVRMKLRSSASDGFSIAPVGSHTNHGIVFHGTGNSAQINLKAANGTNVRIDNGGILVSSTSYAIRSLANGSTGAAAFAFDNDRSSGMYRIGSNNLGLTVDGSKCLDMKTTDVSTPMIFGVGQFATGSLPTASSYEGYIAYDTTTQTMKFSNGTSWVAM